MRRSSYVSLGTIVVSVSLTIAHAGNYMINYSKVDTSGWNCYLCEFDRLETRRTTSKSQMLTSADGNARFGRETGLDKSGVSPSLDLSFEDARASGWITNVQAHSIGLDSMSSSVRIAKPGKLRLQLQRRIMLDNTDKDAFSPFRRFGDRLTLDDQWVSGFSTREFAALPEQKQPTYLRTERVRTNFVGWFQLLANLSIETRILNEQKQGTLQTYRDGFYQSTGLPKPVDWEVRNVESSITYENPRVLASLKHRKLRFDNAHATLRWISPYDAQGFIRQSAYARDHADDSNQFNASVKLGSSSRLHLNFSNGESQQLDQPLLAYTNNERLRVVPTGMEPMSIKVRKKHFALSMTHEFAQGLQFQVRHEETNRTDLRPPNLLRHVIGDLLVLDDHESPSYDLTSAKTNVNLVYRIGLRSKVVVGYQRVSKTRNLQEIDNNQSDQVWIEVMTDIGNHWRIKSRGEWHEGEASTFSQITSNNPLTRRFHQAERDQWEWTGRVDFQPSESPWFTYLSLGYQKRDFPDSPLGLQEQQVRSAFLGFSFLDLSTRSLDIALGFQANSSDTLGSNYFELGNWRYRNRDKVETSSLQYIEDRFLFASTRLRVELQKVDGMGLSSVGSLSNTSDFPTTLSNDQMAEINIDFARWKSTVVSVTYAWSKYRSYDWSIDGIEQASLSNVLSLGRRNNNLVNQMLAFAVEKQF